MANEARFQFAFEEQGWRKPRWIRRIRKATGLEDSRGFDFFAVLDVGEIPLQIKSSIKGAEEYCKNHPENADCLIIIVTENHTSEMIREETLRRLEEMRTQLLPLRTGAWSIPPRRF